MPLNSLSADFSRFLPHAVRRGAVIATVLFLSAGVSGQIIVDTEIDMLPVADGNCTLREAVINANDDAGTQPDCSAGVGADDQIIFAPGVESINLIGPIDITDSLIMGNEDQPVTIIGSGNSRLFAVPVPVDTEFRFMTMTGGFTEEDGGLIDFCVRSTGEGGALCSVGTVILNNIVIADSETNGESAFGGGLYAFQLIGTNFALIGNSTNGFAAPGGGGILVGEVNQSIVNAVIEDNRTTGGNDSDGGGLLIVGPSLIANSRVENNSTAGDNSAGGGIFTFGGVLLTNSSINSNETLGAFSPGGGIGSESSMFIQTSTIAFNQTLGIESSGGGIFSESEIQMQNSTVSNNSASPTNSTGGGLNVREPPVIHNSTISNNSSSRGGAGLNVSSMSTEPVQLISTILADNSGPLGNLSATGLTVNGEASLFGDDPGEINGSAVDMIFSNSPRLQPLADNGCVDPAGFGGSLQCVATRLLDPTSQAREQGINPLVLNSDQRGEGFDRTLGPQTDIGAIEMPFLPMATIPVPVFHPLGLMVLVLCTLILALVSLPSPSVFRQ